MNISEYVLNNPNLVLRILSAVHATAVNTPDEAWSALAAGRKIRARCGTGAAGALVVTGIGDTRTCRIGRGYAWVTADGTLVGSGKRHMLAAPRPIVVAAVRESAERQIAAIEAVASRRGRLTDWEEAVLARSRAIPNSLTV